MRSKFLSFKVEDDLIRVKLLETGLNKEELLKFGQEYNSKISAIYKKKPKTKFNIILDIRKSEGLKLDVPQEVTDNVDQITKDPQTIKVAVLGQSKFLDFISDILLPMLKSRRINYFSDEKLALRWLNK